MRHQLKREIWKWVCETPPMLVLCIPPPKINWNNLLRIWESSWRRNWANAGSINLTLSAGGAGFLFRHKFDINQTMLRKNESWKTNNNHQYHWKVGPKVKKAQTKWKIGKMMHTGWFFCKISNRTSAVLYLRTSSRVTGPSPAMLPNAQTDCSATLIDSDRNRLTNFGIAPALATVSVWSDVPDAMFVNAHAASNCKLTL